MHGFKLKFHDNYTFELETWFKCKHQGIKLLIKRNGEYELTSNAHDPVTNHGPEMKFASDGNILEKANYVSGILKGDRITNSDENGQALGITNSREEEGYTRYQPHKFNADGTPLFTHSY